MTDKALHKKSKRLIKVAVRLLVEQVLRGGDLHAAAFSPARALEAIRIHARLQKSRPADYQAEVPVSERIETDALVLELAGRIDGVFRDGERVALEEIKTTLRPLAELAEEQRPLHWGQLRVYGALYARQHDLAALELRLTTVRADTGEVQTLALQQSREQLDAFLADLVQRYLAWAERLADWNARRNEALRGLTFPYGTFRLGQRDMAVAVYRAIRKGGQLLVQAPTGIGKTVAALFPALKALGSGEGGRVFYLTARSTGKAVAEAALETLRGAGARVRAVTITAKEKICPSPEAACTAEECSYARGYYDRLGGALEALFGRQDLTREAIEAAAAGFRLCPFELSLELSLTADVVVGDYNYAFDPGAFLRRHFLDEGPAEATFLVDEAHNLVDRAREMFSAELRRKPVLSLRRVLVGEQPELARRLGRVSAALNRLRQEAADMGGHSAENQPPEGVLGPLTRALQAAEDWLLRGHPAPFRATLQQFLFDGLSFLRVAEAFDASYVTLAEADGQELRLRLLCLDPSSQMRHALKRARAAIFFSATLTPPEYFRTVWGLDPRVPFMALPSPFAAGNLGLFLSERVSTLFRHRERSLTPLAEDLLSFVSRRKGNYLLYFPSYAYLQRVHEAFAALAPELETVVQSAQMSEPERERFIGRFAADNPHTLVGFAVMGGVFGEGIDLVGERLCGAAIVGVGLPGICPERELIRDHFEEQLGQGFDFAYRFPGLTRVLQAAGRVIRSERDRGAVLLIDPRFASSRYRMLLPGHWVLRRVRTPVELAGALERFWGPR